MKRRKDAESSELSRTFCSTCSHRTASAADPGAFAMARRATRDTDASTLSIAIEPARSSPRSVRRSTTTLTSSLATSARTTSPSGSIDGARQVDDVRHEPEAPEQGEDLCDQRRRDHEAEPCHAATLERIRSPRPCFG